MIHNNMINLETVKKNLEDAIFSKLLNIGQTSGRAEMHSPGFNALVESLQHIEKMIAEQQPKAEEPKVSKKTQ